MPKLLWVALPLLLAAGWVSWQALRRRTPSRQALNIGSSVLLLAYVLTTAGLGIFWVANQQLPVFDWHYLFGYGTVLLVALHLAFNFGVVWRYLTRSRSAPPVRQSSTPDRRGALGVLGVLLATGAAFALGMRQGRSTLSVASGAGLGPRAASATGSDPAAVALELIERFHAFSSHSRSGVFLRAPGIDWGEPPAAFKRYPASPRTALPAAGDAVGGSFDLRALGTVLWHSTGVSEVRGGLQLRAAPSSGALFPSELYVAARSVHGLAPGLWHYDPQTHALERVGDAVLDEVPSSDLDGASVHEAAALVVATAVFRRTGYKYRDRTYRYVLADLGHALENLRVAAGVVGAMPRFLTAFDEAQTAAALGLDQAEEGVLAVAAFFDAAAIDKPLAQQGTARVGEPLWRLPPLAGEGSATLGVTAAVHAATSLQAVGQRTVSAARPRPAPPPSPTSTIALPRAAPVRSNLLQVIARRRSVRRFAPTPLSRDALAAVLARMTEGPGILSPAVRVDVVVHAVAGIAPGAYRHDALRHALVPRRAGTDLRAAARAAALDQDVIGDAAVVFVLSIDRAVFGADLLGAARGYRHAFLEAGLVGERVYLEAGARGLGACAVGAFYDDEAAALVGIDPGRQWVVHLAALGAPAS